MDSDTLSLLAAVATRSGSNTNPLMQQILALHGLNPDATTNINSQELIAKLGERDPMYALIAQQLLQPTENVGNLESNLTNNSEEDIEKRIEKLKRKGRALNKFRQMIDGMYMELEHLRDINDSLAAALGACYLCWGKNPLCELCGGSGHAGTFEPDQKLFRELIFPALLEVQRNFRTTEKQFPNKELIKPNSENNKDIEMEKGGK